MNIAFERQGCLCRFEVSASATAAEARMVAGLAPALPLLPRSSSAEQATAPFHFCLQTCVLPLDPFTNPAHSADKLSIFSKQICSGAG